MRSYSVVLFSLLLISSIILVSSFENSFGDDVIATSIGFEDSTILELKNSRGNTASIDSVRIWLSGENEFKSFKTEQGWIGKNTPQGVIVFTSQNEINPGEGVKFGIKTSKQNPVINWKAVDSSGKVINSASTKTTILETDDEKTELNELQITGIKDKSVFRFIPDKPSSNSNFRVIGENFVPGQSLDFYIQNDFEKSIEIDSDGKIFFTAKTPKTQGDERTEFILRDSGGNEKIISMRIPEAEKRDILESIKLSIGNTPKDVKRGDDIVLNGMGTPGATLTITTKHQNGGIQNIETIKVDLDGKWNLEQLISPETELGQLGIEVSDGKTKVLRSFNIISSTLINVFTEKSMYEPGDAIKFSGKAISAKNMSIVLEDSVGADIFSRSISVGETGLVDFEIDISRDSLEGTYVLHLFQGDEEGIAIFGVGQEPEPILVLRPVKLNFQGNENIQVTVHGTPNGQVALILIDSADREIFSDTINLGPNGKKLYEIDSNELSSGAYIISGKRGESVDEAKFTIGFTTGSGAIIVQTTKSDYKQNEQVLILGNTGSTNVLLDIIISNPAGETIKKVETFSDKFGVFKIDNFRIPMDGKHGIWKVTAKSGSNFNSAEFSVVNINEELTVQLDKENYVTSEIMNISGTNAAGGATVTLKIFDMNGNMIEELNITATSNGEFSTIWKFPNDSITGEYEILVDDGRSNTSIKFTLN